MAQTLSLHWLLNIFSIIDLVSSEPIFFELYGTKEECVFDFFDAQETIQFFYEIRAEQYDRQRRTEVEITIRKSNNQEVATRNGYQSRVHFEVAEEGVYKICFAMPDSSPYQITVVGIEMLGLKSETHYHQKDLVKEEHINPMYARLIDIGGTLDELESMQSASKNWAINFWEPLHYSEENLAFYAWLQGWLLLIMSIFQIRKIRQWFARAAARAVPSKTRGYGRYDFKV